MQAKEMVLIIYDIHDNKRRAKLAKLLQGYGYRIQESAFIAKIRLSLLEKMMKQIGKIVRDDDDVRVIKILESNMQGFYKQETMVFDELVVV